MHFDRLLGGQRELCVYHSVLAQKRAELEHTLPDFNVRCSKTELEQVILGERDLREFKCARWDSGGSRGPCDLECAVDVLEGRFGFNLQDAHFEIGKLFSHLLAQAEL